MIRKLAGGKYITFDPFYNAVGSMLLLEEKSSSEYESGFSACNVTAKTTIQEIVECLIYHQPFRAVLLTQHLIQPQELQQQYT